MNLDQAETLALQGLTFLAADPQRLTRFLSLTGTTPDDLKTWAENPHLQSAVLEHFMTDESLLMVAAADLSVAPEAFGRAQSVLLKERDR